MFLIAADAGLTLHLQLGNDESKVEHKTRLLLYGNCKKTTARTANDVIAHVMSTNMQRGNYMCTLFT